MADQHVISIKREGVGFIVGPDPAIPARPDLTAHRGTHREAMRCAKFLGMAKGWKVRDMTGGGNA